MMKRFFDIFLSALTLFFIWPLFLVFAVLIKLDSKGSVFYKQIRVGKDNTLFNIYKFRKYYNNSDPDGPNLSLSDDRRLTKIGKIFEEYKLNELPQFFNVFKGDMSLVGPRPETPDFVNEYKDGYFRVLDVKQGIFGVNQLIFRSESELFPEDEEPEEFYIRELLPKKIKNDIEYIQNADFFSDVAILVNCIWKVIREPIFAKLNKKNEYR